MPATWLISDTHFGHDKTCTVFKRDDGTPLRPFRDAEEMDEELVRRWNERVRKNDKVYHLGDVVIARKSLATLYRLNGDKVLIKGNHDIFKLNDYTNHFRDIRGYHVMSGLILSHVPVHADSIERFGCNVHGHLHFRRVMLGNRIDPRYFNVSVECIDFAPILLEDLKKRILEQGGGIDMKKSRHEVD
jgi:calcineurin-like phosphoesterase family protein